MKKHNVQNIKPNRYVPDQNKGLTSNEVDIRHSAGLTNKVKTKTSKTYLQIISENVLSLFNIIIYCIFAFLLVCKYVFNFNVTITKFLFIVPAAFNLLIGTVQQIKSKIVLDKLSLIKKTKYRVIRDSFLVEVDSTELVADDIITLMTGQQIPVDATVLSGQLEVNESILTGESDNVVKNPGDKLLSSSFIVSGFATCHINNVGEETYAAKLQNKMKEINDNSSELMLNINNIIKITTGLLIFVFIISVLSSIYKMNTYHDMSWNDIVLSVAAVSIGCVPNGLILLTSVTLAVSVIRLSKKNVLVQELYSLENLSRVDTICLDKTGTLTTGKMEVVNEILYIEPDVFYDYIGTFLSVNAGNNQTGIALINKYQINDNHIVKSTNPFSSTRKCASVLLDDKTSLVLGAPEYITKDANILAKAKEYADDGYRVLSFSINNKIAALIIISDIIRDNVNETIQYLYDNNVDIKIISGDNPFTVSKIAEKCGVKDAHKCINMQEILPEDIDSVVDNFTVFGRISPEQKELVVKALQKREHNVAMTGDGVNDVLALKSANCSISFNTATDSAKNISDVVLLDDSFSSIPDIILEGRRVVNNISRTAILFLSKTVFIVLFALLSLFIKDGVTLLNSESLYIFEICVVAIGGFIISQEPNREPITGTFKAKVYSKALVNGSFIATAAAIPIIMFISGSIETQELSQSMLSVMITISSFIIFWKLLDPVNTYRCIAFTICVLLALLLVFALPSIFVDPSGITNIMDIFTGSFSIDTSPFANFTVNMYIAIIVFISVCIPSYLIINTMINFLLKKNEDIKQLIQDKTKTR